MPKLGVNIDHVATLRQARKGKHPSPVQAARICERAGAHSIVMHLREDRRHIQDRDLFEVKRAVSIKLNLEMSIAPSVVKVARRLCPDQVTFVPERRIEMTTEGGLDLFRKTTAIKRCIDFFKRKNVLVSLFVDPDPRQVERAGELGADAIELHTGDYANAKTETRRKRELERLRRAAALSADLSLLTHAGHGLDYENVLAVKRIPGVEELNIGYSIVTRALWVGLEEAVRKMRRLVE